MELYYEHKNDMYKIQIEQKADTWEIQVNDTVYSVSASDLGNGKIHITANELAFRPRIYCNGQKRFVFLDGETYCFKRAVRFATAHDHVEGEIMSPIGGKIVKTFVSAGDIVEKHQDLLIIESMKMEHKVKAPMKGTVMKVRYSEGAIVDTGEVLVDMERDKSTDRQAEW